MDNIVNQEKICDLLGISRATLYRWRKEGIPVIKIRGKVMYDIESVQKWIKTFETQGDKNIK